MQISMFDKPRYKIPRNKKIVVIELFGGIGSQFLALKRLGLDVESRLIEIDKYAVQSYNAVHGTNFKPMDITKITADDLGVENDGKEYILTYSFPCQALSVAGKQGGMTEGSGTTSSLLWEVRRLLKELYDKGTMPSVLVMENVPQVHGTKFIADFNKWQEFLRQIGYENYRQDLNSKEYANIPQNRNRCFMVSVRGGYSYEFPKPIPLTKKLSDVLEKNVDEKFYLREDATLKVVNQIKDLVRGGCTLKTKDKPLKRTRTLPVHCSQGITRECATEEVTE